MSNTQYPFKTAVQALVHAFNDERHGGARPASSRLADKYLGEPPAFSGSDGGAEKATALDMLEKGLKPLHMAALRARYAPRTRRCSHCKSLVPRDDWIWAMRQLADAARDAVDMRSIKDALMLALVQRYYEGNTPGLERIATDHAVSTSSVSRANSIVTPFLRGAKKAKGDSVPLQGIEQAAMAQAEEILRGGGFIP